MKKWVVYLLLAAFFPRLPAYAEELQISMEPYSAAYLDYICLPEEERAGLLPPLPVESDHDLLPVQTFAAEAPLPAQYDSRDVDVDGDGEGDISFISEPKNQMQTEGCWAFAASSCIESFLRKKQFEQTQQRERFDFSEWHMEHSTYSAMRDYVNVDGAADRTVNAGGNLLFAGGYLMRGAGPVNDEELPFDNRTDALYLGQIQKPVSAQVRGLRFIAQSEIDQTGREALQKQLKRAIMEYGEAYVSLEYKNSYYNAYTYGFYDPSDEYKVNHAVTVVGWDDAYPKENFKTIPSRDGAWIAKNSWGADRDDGGYFYISYDTPSVYFLAGYVTDAAETVEYDHAYYNCPLMGISAIGFGSDTAYAANVFTKQPGEELLTDVAFVTRGYTEYEIYVNPVGSAPAGAQVQFVQSGTVDYMGYTTVKLQNPVALDGEQFAVIIKYTMPGVEYVVPVVPKEQLAGTDYSGVSWISTNGSVWVDSYTYSNLGVLTQINAYTVNSAPKTTVRFEKPLERTVVNVEKDGAAVKPNADGSYSLADGVYGYTARTMGYADVDGTFEVQGEQELLITIEGEIGPEEPDSPPRLLSTDTYYRCTETLPDYAEFIIDYGAGNSAATSCTPYAGNDPLPSRLYKIEGEKLLIAKELFMDKIPNYEGVAFSVVFDDAAATTQKATILFQRESLERVARSLKDYLAKATDQTTPERLLADAGSMLPYGGSIELDGFSVTYPTLQADGALEGRIIVADGRGQTAEVDCSPYVIRKFTQDITVEDHWILVQIHQNVPGISGTSIMATYDGSGRLIGVHAVPLTEVDQTAAYSADGYKKLFLLDSNDLVTPYDRAYTIY